MKFGIIGHGSFGKLLADILSEHGQVYVYARNKSSDESDDQKEYVSLEKAASADVVIMAVGLEPLEQVSGQLASLVKKDTIVVDVCSVKIKPTEIITRNLGGKCRLLFTHPLFGPHTAKDGKIAGKSIVVCPFDFKGKEKIMKFLEDKLGLKVIEMTAEEHDQEMAWVHGLTFFVGRGLMELNPPKSDLSTGYYQRLLDLVELESTHSLELFNTVQKGNPFAADIRRELIDKLEMINKEIGN